MTTNQESKRILCTGGAGFLGSHVVDQLVDRGHTVFVLDDLSSCWMGEDLERPRFLHEDAKFINTFDEAPVETCAPLDAIVHLAMRHPVEREMSVYEKSFDGYVAQALELLAGFAPTRRLRRFVAGAVEGETGPAAALCASLRALLGYWHRPPALGTYFVRLPELEGQRRLPEAHFPETSFNVAGVRVAASALADLADGTRRHQKDPDVHLERLVGRDAIERIER